MLPPAEKITFQNAPSPQEFNEGDVADIVCDIISSPPPTIVWKYKGFTIQFSKDGELSAALRLPSTFLLSSVTEEAEAFVAAQSRKEMPA